MEVLQAYDFQCLDCDSKTNTLTVHHRYYVKDRLPWNYPLIAFAALCEECHKHRQATEADSQQDWEWGLDLMSAGNPCVLQQLFEILEDAWCDGKTPEPVLRALLFDAMNKIRESRKKEAA